MNAAILANDQVAQVVYDAIVKFYNPYLQTNGQPPLNVAAVIDNNRGGGVFKARNP